jgi:hypothetical protein
LGEGATVTLVIESDGRFAYTMKLSGEADDITTGTLGFDGEYLALRFDDDSSDEASFFISLVEDILTLRGQVELDLDNNGTADLGILALILNRN